MNKGAISVNKPLKKYYAGGGWGNHVSFSGWDNGASVQSVYGHKSDKPRNGDILIVEMKSGRNAVFVFRNVRYPGDPSDMFFAEAAFIGYEDEGILQKCGV